MLDSLQTRVIGKSSAADGRQSLIFSQPSRDAMNYSAGM